MILKHFLGKGEREIGPVNEIRETMLHHFLTNRNLCEIELVRITWCDCSNHFCFFLVFFSLNFVSQYYEMEIMWFWIETNIWITSAINQFWIRKNWQTSMPRLLIANLLFEWLIISYGLFRVKWNWSGSNSTDRILLMIKWCKLHYAFEVT